MCLTDDDDIADKLRTLRNHGQLGGEFVVAAGNSRMTEIAAALGLAQLQRLNEILGRRRELASLYAKALDGALDIQATPDGAVSNYQTFGAILPQGFARKSVCEKLHDQGHRSRRPLFCDSQARQLRRERRIAADRRAHRHARHRASSLPTDAKRRSRGSRPCPFWSAR